MILFWIVFAVILTADGFGIYVSLRASWSTAVLAVSYSMSCSIRFHGMRTCLATVSVDGSRSFQYV